MENIDIASYADDNTPYTTGNSIEEVIQKLENAAKALFHWFSDNQMKAYPDKCHFLCNSNSQVSMTIERQIIKKSKFEKLIGIKLDSKFNFNSHLHDICQKAGQKLNAIFRITPNMDFAKRRLLVNAFFYSQFNYCQLVWMCHNRTSNSKINRLHERCLCLIYNDKKSSFKALNTCCRIIQGFQRRRSSYFCRSFSCIITKSIQYEELLIFCYASCQNGQPWIRKIVIHRFKIVGQYTIPYERYRLY